MIFYTLQGPNHKLEFHDDKLRLTKRIWWMIFSPKDRVLEFKLTDLAEFKITTAKVVTGKLEWSTFAGAKASFRFTTNAAMMTMIEKYVHTLIAKNNVRRHVVVPAPASTTIPQVPVAVEAPLLFVPRGAPAAKPQPIPAQVTPLSFKNHKLKSRSKKKLKKVHSIAA